jgi:GDP-L-fucose synthase
MPTNLYGLNDNFDLHTSHVLPAMIRKFHEAKMTETNVQLWGSGSPFREFLFVDDLASAVELALSINLKDDIYNVGYGTDMSIKDVAELVQDITGHKGEIIWDQTKPDGTPKKLMDSSKLRSTGWQPKVKIKDGIEMTYEWYINKIKKNKCKGV